MLMKKNIRTVLFGELVLFLVVFFISTLGTSFGFSGVTWFLDWPSLILVLIILIPGLIIMGEWKDFCKSFSVLFNFYFLNNGLIISGTRISM